MINKKNQIIMTLICFAIFGLLSTTWANSVSLSVSSNVELSNTELFQKVSEELDKKLNFIPPPKNSLYIHSFRYQYEHFGNRDRRSRPEYISSGLSTSVSQAFVSTRDCISSIKFYVLPNSSIPESIYTFTLKDLQTGQLLAIQTFTVSEIKDENETDIEIEIKFLPIPESKNRRMVFSIETSSLQPQSKIFLRCNKSSTQTNTTLSINNSRVAGTMIFSAGYMGEPVFQTENENKNMKNGLTNRKSPFIVLADYFSVEDKNLVRLALYSFKEKTYMYFYENIVANHTTLQETVGNFADILLSLINKNSLPIPFSINASTGDHSSEIFITWKTHNSDLSYNIYRAETFMGTWQKIGTSNSTSFIDRTILPNIVYWYKIQSISDSQFGVFSEKVQGYFITPHSKSQTLNDIMVRKKERKEAMANRDRERIEFSFLNKYFFGSIKLNLAMAMAIPYLTRREVYLLTNPIDFSDYTLDFNKRIIYLTHDKKQMLAQLNSNGFFSFIADAASINEVLALYPINKNFNPDTLIKGLGEPQDGGVKFISPSAELQFKNLNLDSTIVVEIKFVSANFISENRLYDFEIHLNGIRVPQFYQFGRNTLRFSVPKDFANSEKLTISLAYHSFVPQRTVLWLSEINFYSQVYDEQLVDRLIKNSVFASIHEENLKMSHKNGTQTIIPSFVSAGLITEYYRNWKDWRLNAIIFETSNRQLREKLMKRMNE